MARKIKVTSQRVSRLVITSPKLDRVNPADIADALNATSLSHPQRDVSEATENRVPEKILSVNGTD